MRHNFFTVATFAAISVVGKMLLKLVIALILPCFSAASHFYLMPYPIFEERSDRLNDFITQNGRLKKSITPDVITAENQHQFPDQQHQFEDGASFVVGSHYKLAPGTVEDSSYILREPRQIADHEKKVYVNGRYGRGLGNFKPSPLISKNGVQVLMGQWAPGSGDWRGLHRNPMTQQYRPNYQDADVGVFV